MYKKVKCSFLFSSMPLPQPYRPQFDRKEVRLLAPVTTDKCWEDCSPQDFAVFPVLH